MKPALAAILLCCAAAFAQPAGPDPRLMADLTTLERSAANRALSLRERESAADQAIGLRRRLIEAAPEDDRLVGWLIDQSAGLLIRLGRDGSDTAVLFGMPSGPQREAVRTAATESAQHLARASRLLGGGPEGAQEDERRVRIAFFRARAEILLASLTDGDQRSRHAQAALAAIGKTGFAAAGPEAMRRVNMGAALLMKASPPKAEDARLAVEELAWAALGGDKPEEPALSIPGATRAEGWFGLVHAAGAMGNAHTAAERLKQAMLREPFSSGGRPDPLLAVLAADTLTRVFFEQGLARGDQQLLERAVAEQLALVSREDLGFRADTLRPAAFDKLAALAERAPKASDLPAGFALAGAIRTARDPQQRGSAIEAFERIAARPDAGGFAADALWESAVLLLQPGEDPGEQMRGLAALVRLAREHPQHARATDAMAAALSFAKHLAKTVPPGRQAIASDAYRSALVLATERYQGLPDIDLWRYERGRLALSDAAPEQELRSALGALRQIARPSADAVRLTERIQAAVLDQMRQRLRETRAAGNATAAREIASSELEPEARTAYAWARAHKIAYERRFEADLADAMTDAGRPDGRLIYQQLLRGSAEDIPGGQPRLKLGLARSLLNAGKAREAFPCLRETAAALDAPGREPGGPVRPDDFWHAWTLMLELLAGETGEQEEKAGTIRAHIRRLSAIDPQFGGPPWRERIAAVRDRVN